MPRNQAKRVRKGPNEKLAANDFVDEGSSDKENSMPNRNSRGTGADLREAQHELNSMFNDLIRDAFGADSSSPAENGREDEKDGQEEGASGNASSSKGGINGILVNQIVNVIAADRAAP